MEEKIKRAVLYALHRNNFTANEAIEVIVKGRVVILTGSVRHEELIYEAVATAEAVSSKLRVYSNLEVGISASAKV
jgi:osmotically-inducible protein OsmY